MWQVYVQQQKIKFMQQLVHTHACLTAAEKKQNGTQRNT